MKISLIVACGPDGEIGRGGRLPWPSLLADMRWFRKNTLGKPVIMGRRTWESLPAENRPLPGRGNFILSRNRAWYPDYTQPADDPDTSVDVHRSVETVLDYLRGEWGGDEAVVIGGGTLYAAFLPKADRVYLTKVEPPADVRLAADTFFPYSELYSGRWAESRPYDRWFPGPYGYSCGFYTYSRKE